MKRLTRALVASLLVSCVISLNAIPANAWGPSGHRIVAIIAERHLQPKTKKAIKEILGEGVTLASVANYADAVRNFKPETKNFHYVDIPKDANNYDANRDCPDTPKGDCIIKALERFTKQVVKENEPLAKRRFALKFIVHLVGDMHQPLHCANNNDVGGNNVEVRWFGKNTNLHKVWDSAIINEAELTDDEFADALDDDLSDQQIQAIQAGNVLTWALESHKAAQGFAYDIPPSHSFGQAYYEHNAPVVDRQLLRAGLRLAKVLNFLFQ